MGTATSPWRKTRTTRHIEVPDGHPWEWEPQDFYRLGCEVCAQCPFGDFTSERRSYSSKHEAAQQLVAHLTTAHNLSESEAKQLVHTAKAVCLRATMNIVVEA